MRRRVFVWLLLLVMVAMLLPANTIKAKAAPEVSGLTATNQLTASGDALVSDSAAHAGTSYNGYIQSNEGDKKQSYVESDYVKVTYKVEGEVTDDTKVFILQTYDTSWGGWAGVELSIGESEYDAATGLYTYYVETGNNGSYYNYGDEDFQKSELSVAGRIIAVVIIVITSAAVSAVPIGTSPAVITVVSGIPAVKSSAKIGISPVGTSGEIAEIRKGYYGSSEGNYNRQNKKSNFLFHKTHLRNIIL